MRLLKINNFEFDNGEIKEYKVAYNKIDGDGTKRNLEGTMRRQVIANKAKISVSIIDNMKASRVSEIIKYITLDTASIEFYDPKTNSIKRIDGYMNVPEPSIYAVINGEVRYASFSFNIIEL